MVKRKDENEYSVILDTSFMIRLLNDSDPLHSNAKGIFVISWKMMSRCISRQYRLPNIA